MGSSGATRLVSLPLLLPEELVEELMESEGGLS